jgi:sugar/nucleoside kinase (ribokinase family)
VFLQDHQIAGLASFFRGEIISANQCVEKGGGMGSGLLCVGLATVDIAARAVDRLSGPEGAVLIEGIEMAPAGTAAGAALVAAALGVKTSLVSMAGADRKGRFLRMALAEQGVDVSLLAEHPTRPTSATLIAIDSEGRRPSFHAFGAGHFGEVTDGAIAAARAARFVHWAGVGSPKLDGGPGASLVQAAHAAGAIVTCDLIAPRATALDELRRLLPHVDYFLPSVAEAFALAQTQDLAQAADFFLGLGAGACIIKNGAAGSYLALGARRLSLPAHAITPLDTTSCGDSYCAGFIAALDRGWAVVDACRFATATAALVALGLGTLGRVETFEATEMAMRQMPLNEAA